MRPWEVVLAVVVFGYLLHLLSPLRGDVWWLALVPFLAAGLALVHVATEGPRWQMAPLYCLVGVLVAYECVRWFMALQAPYFVALAGLAVELLAVGLSTALPVFELLPPTGPFKIGTQVRYLVDRDRSDPFADHPERGRELMVQLWYPADPTAEGQPAPYRDRRITRLKDAQFSLVRTHAILGAPISTRQQNYPLLVYVPSWSGIRTECTMLAEDLASHGYIVAALDHPYSSRITIFPDGRIAERKFVGEIDYSSDEAYASFLATADQQAEIRARDAIYLLDVVRNWHADDNSGFAGRFDLDRVGIFGFSFGGATAAEASRRDSRFKAGMYLDGMLAGVPAKEGARVPFMFMLEDFLPSPAADFSKLIASERRAMQLDQSLGIAIQTSIDRAGGYMIVAPNLNHLDFADFPFYSPLIRHRRDPDEVARAIRLYARAFFDKYLKGLNDTVLDGSVPDAPTWQVFPGRANGLTKAESRAHANAGGG